MTDSRKSALWIVNSDGSQNRYLTDGQSPRWSPAGAALAFLACGTPGGDRNALSECGEGSHQQVYVRIMTGAGQGAITQVTRLTESASNIQWSPDGASIAFNSFVLGAGPKPLVPPGKPEGARWTDEPRIVDQLDYRQDGRGFDRHGFTHIFTVTAEGGTPRDQALTNRQLVVELPRRGRARSEMAIDEGPGVSMTSCRPSQNGYTYSQYGKTLHYGEPGRRPVYARPATGPRPALRAT